MRWPRPCWYLWPLTRKRSERLAVLKRIAVHKPFISRSNASSYPFIKIHHPFERLELSVRKNSSALRTAQAIRSKKIVSRSNGLRYPFEKIHQPFERLELSVRNKSSAVRTVRAIRSRNPSISRSYVSSSPFKIKLIIMSHSNGSTYLFEKFISCSKNGSNYPLEKAIHRPSKENNFFGSG